MVFLFMVVSFMFFGSATYLCCEVVVQMGTRIVDYIAGLTNCDDVGGRTFVAIDEEYALSGKVNTINVIGI